MESFLNDRVTLYPGDCLDVLARLAPDSMDSCVCDPPYHLTSIVKRFANAKPDTEKFAINNPSKQFGSLSRGFMGKQWDGGDIAFTVDLWAQVYRVLKPGAHLIAFSGTRTYHRMACAIEDAGFEIRDQIGWAYGSGFPKSHDVSKGIDRAAGAEREVLSRTPTKVGVFAHSGSGAIQDIEDYEHIVTAPATDAAREWDGWGTALKPAWEPCVLARKPLIGTVAQNVLAHGTGAINIEGCRVAAEKPTGWGGAAAGGDTWNESNNGLGKDGEARPVDGRWPANILHDGSDEVVGAFPDETGVSSGTQRTTSASWLGTRTKDEDKAIGFGDSGSAARFFYTAKADGDDRIGSKHPTVKPVDLMQYLVRLVTPKGGLVLDPFAGTGTTGEAAFLEGMRAVLIEREAEYQADIRRRMSLCLSGPDERRRESIKAKTKDQPMDAGPLFEGIL